MARKPKEPDKIRQYIASVEAKLVKATGKTMAYWVRVARKCPHAKPAERLRWLKARHGLGLAHAGVVLGRAFGLAALDRDQPGDALDRVFSGRFAEQKALYDIVAVQAARLGRGTVRVRRGHVAFHRLKQFAALKPSRDGLLLGLALESYPRGTKLRTAKNMGDGSRIKMALLIGSRRDFDKSARGLLARAYAEA